MLTTLHLIRGADVIQLLDGVSNVLALNRFRFGFVLVVGGGSDVGFDRIERRVPVAVEKVARALDFAGKVLGQTVASPLLRLELGRLLQQPANNMPIMEGMMEGRNE